MHSEVSEISPVEVEVKVQVPWDQVRKDLDSTFLRVAKSAKLKGFRPGKVPRDVVRKVFGPQVRAEVAGNMIEAGLTHAVQTHELHVVAQPTVSPPPLTEGADYEFTATLEIQPKIASVALDGLAVTVRKTSVPDEAVEAELAQLRKEHADLKEPDAPRAAKAGDRLTISYTVEIEGEEKPEMAASDREVDLGDDSLLEGLSEGLVGVSVGESKDVELVFPDTHPNEEIRGKTAVLHVTVSALREVLLPALDDDFAQDVGEFETLDALRADIRAKLEGLGARRREAELKDKLIDALIAKNEITVPPTLIQQEKRQSLYQMMTFAQMMGRQITPADFEGLDERAERRVKAGLLLGALARQEGVEIGDEAVEAKLAEMAATSGKHIARLRAEHTGEKRDALVNDILEEKLFALLEARAQITEAESTEAEDAAEAAGSEE